MSFATKKIEQVKVLAQQGQKAKKKQKTETPSYLLVNRDDSQTLEAHKSNVQVRSVKGNDEVSWKVNGVH